MFGRAALDGVGNDLLRADGGRLAGFGFQPLDQVGGIAAGVGLDLLQEKLACLVGRQAGDTLQLALPLGHQLLDSHARGGSGLFLLNDRLLLGTQLLFDAIAHGQPVGQRAGLVGKRLFEAEDFLPPLLHLPLGFRGRSVRLLARFERRFLSEAFSVAFRLAAGAIGFCLGSSDGVGCGSTATGHPPEDDADGE
jgi:hypothetical protein